MLVATLTRMGGGLLTFILFARNLSPEPFGLIATAMAYSAFVSIVTDFGLGTSAIREAAAAPEHTREVMADVLAVKGFLTLLVGLLGGLLLALLMPPGRLLVYALIFSGALAYSFGELMLVAARANQKFGIEVNIVLTTSIAMLLLLGGVAVLTKSATAVSVAFAVTRFGYLILVLSALRTWIGNPFSREWRDITSCIKRASSYAVDSLLTSLATQIDVLLFGVFLSLHDMGIYQSGARLVQVILPFAVALSTVYLPGLVAAHAQGRDGDYVRNAERLTWEFTGLALLGGAGFAFVAPIATNLLYGKAYSALHPLWDGFAVFAALRLAASSYGIQMAALGHIKFRLLSNISAISVLFLTTLLILPSAGMAATTWLLALSAAPPFLILGLTLIYTGSGGRHVPASMIAVIVVGIGLIIARMST